MKSLSVIRLYHSKVDKAGKLTADMQAIMEETYSRIMNLHLLELRVY